MEKEIEEGGTIAVESGTKITKTIIIKPARGGITTPSETNDDLDPKKKRIDSGVYREA